MQKPLILVNSLMLKALEGCFMVCISIFMKWTTSIFFVLYIHLVLILRLLFVINNNNFEYFELHKIKHLKVVEPSSINSNHKKN